MHQHVAVCCLLVLATLIAAGTDVEEDCISLISSAISSALEEDLANDVDILSLIQVNAVAIRKNRTPHVNQSIGQNRTLSMSWLRGSRFAEGMLLLPISVDSLQRYKAFYMVFALFVVLLVVNSSLMCSYFRHEEQSQKLNSPKIKFSVDHLVATSKLAPGAMSTKSQLSFYTADKKHREYRKCPTVADMVVADKPKSQPPCLLQKSHASLEALDIRLVLPLRETWYAVAIEQALKADASFDILRITGSPSLRACVSYGSSGCGGVLDLFCSSGEADHQLVARASSTSGTSLSLTLVDAQERCLGELRPTASKSFEFVRQGEKVFSLIVDDAGQLQLLAAGGRNDACVSCLAGNLGICVNAGVDTGLVVCLVLAVVLLGGARAYVLPTPRCERQCEEALLEKSLAAVVCCRDTSEV